ncbi:MULTISPECIES: phospholipase D-like domain-containing protein [Natrialbaceae]|uniref:phospholipase D-like domain-containing protein n=1 Tax=Natrialbaceae TaxID=1644061 RepID=UPI00207C1DD0|nr:phospholipase D-like domain-containing protein [Natronococcus sp. CG52]
MTERLQSSASELRIRDPEHVWGVSLESVYLAAAAIAADESMARGLNSGYRASILATNTKRDRTVHTTVHEVLLSKLGLRTRGGRLTNTGVILVTSDDPLPLLQQLVVTELPRVRALLRRLPDDVQGFSRREFESFLQDEYDETVTAPLLASFGFGDLGTYGYEPCTEEVADEILYDRPDQPLPSYAWTTEVVRAMTGVRDEMLLSQIVATLEDEDQRVNVPHTNHDVLLAEPNREPCLDPESITAAISVAVDRLNREQTVIQQLLVTNEDHLRENGSVITIEDVVETTELSRTAAQFVCETVKTCRSRGVDQLPAEYSSTRLDTTVYKSYKLFSSVPEISCQLTERNGVQLLRFHELPVVEGARDQWENIVAFLIDRLQDIETRREQAANLTVGVEPSVRESLAVNQFEQLEEGVIEPTYFAYTLPDPDVLGEEQMNAFVGDSTGLRKERAQLNRWSKTKGPDSRRFTELTDELVSKGLHEELDERILRIMTPYDDDTFSEYASQFRQLLSEGYEIRLLTRHTRKKWQWERLRDNLIGELDTNRENVTIRTYSRYKEFERITSETDARELAEFGIHAKLQAIGHAEEGATLIGSANFMENSYDWNPECGIYTEATNFGAAAREFFDFVWQLSQADEVDLDRLQKIPKQDFYPTYYYK